MRKQQVLHGVVRHLSQTLDSAKTILIAAFLLQLILKGVALPWPIDMDLILLNTVLVASMIVPAQLIFNSIQHNIEKQ
ncbi:MAG: hypothetical protein M3Q44_03835 [bacterium]|nr:hypothetical protein [bacterium]